MRWVVIAVMLVFAAFGIARPQGVVSNGTTAVTGEDSISVVFYNLDSLGQNIGGLDTLRVLVRDPSGDSAFAEVIAGVGGRVEVCANGGDTSYVWRAQVADIDGSGNPGIYSIALTAKSDGTGAWLRTPAKAYFQLASRCPEAVSDSVGQAAVDSRKALDSLGAVLGRIGPSVDSESVADWVWNTPQANHTIAGTFGSRLDANISGLGAGAGVYSFTVTVVDSALDVPIPYAGVAVRNLAQSSLIAIGTAGADGRVSFNLDADSFAVVARATNYVFSGCDTVVVTGAGADTVFGERFDPGSPLLPSLCRVYGFLYDVNGVPVAGAVVSASLPSGVSQSELLLVSPFSVSTTTDNNGYFYLDLIPSSSLTPSGSLYEFTISMTAGTVMRHRIEIPTQASWQLTW